MVSNRDEVVRKMAELMRSGATMLDKSCPLCGAPLFKLRSGETICPTHGPVRIVKSESEAVKILTDAVLDELEDFAARRIHEILASLKSGGSPSEEQSLRYLMLWLRVLKYARATKKSLRKEQ